MGKDILVLSVSKKVIQKINSAQQPSLLHDAGPKFIDCSNSLFVNDATRQQASHITGICSDACGTTPNENVSRTKKGRPVICKLPVLCCQYRLSRAATQIYHTVMPLLTLAFLNK